MESTNDVVKLWGMGSVRRGVTWGEFILNIEVLNF